MKIVGFSNQGPGSLPDRYPAAFPEQSFHSAECNIQEQPARTFMKFIHSRRPLRQGEIVQLDCDTQCNFMLLSDREYEAYQRVAPFRYYGGTFKRFPARIAVPETGDWNIVIDLAGAPGEIQYNITIVLDPTAAGQPSQLAE